jgi:hypothetical protein
MVEVPMRAALLATVCVLAAAATLLAQPPTVRDLVAQLGDDDFDKREAATEALARAGPRILPQLRLARMSATDPEVRLRLNALIPALSARQDRDEALASRLLRLRFAEEPLGEVLRRTGEETGIPFTLPTLPPERLAQPITLDTGDVLPWEAFYRVLEATDLEPTRAPFVDGDPDEAIKVFDNGAEPRYFCPLRLRPLKLVAGSGPIARSHHGLVCVTTPGVVRKGTDYELPVTIAVEPRATIRELERVVFHTVRTDQGEEVWVGSQRGAGHKFREMTFRYPGFWRPPVETLWRQRMLFPIRPERPGTRSLARVQGTAILRLVTPARDLARIALRPGRDHERVILTRDGGLLTLGPVVADTEGSWTIHIEATHPVRGAWAEPGGGELDDRDLSCPFTMIDHGGEIVPMLKGSCHAPDETRCTYHLRFTGTPAQYGPVELLYTGRRHVRVEVPFEFRALPWPGNDREGP